jgi:hypothetical protein
MQCLMLGILAVRSSVVNRPTAVPLVEAQLEEDLGLAKAFAPAALGLGKTVRRVSGRISEHRAHFQLPLRGSL